jgi:hypothetical protein
MKKLSRFLFMQFYRKELIEIAKIIRGRDDMDKGDSEESLNKRLISLNKRLAMIQTLERLDLLA